jgi:hypothetical protein
MSKPFEETRRMAAMTREYNRYVKHGAADAAAGLMLEMEMLEREIQCEEHLYRQTFY